MTKILVIEDASELRDDVVEMLTLEGYEAIGAENGRVGVEKAKDNKPDLIVCDIMMPELDGFETLRMLREFSNIPVIMLTAKGEENDKVYGLELGADDYVTKPFGPRELSSRIKAVLRRTEVPSKSPDQAVLKIDDRLHVDFNRREVIVNGEHIKLRPTEYRLLYHLIENAGWTVPHDQLLAKVWGYEYRDEAHYVRLYVNYLREKIEEDPSNPQYILTERGVGYRFVDYKKAS